jgi:hypothetical protein
MGRVAERSDAGWGCLMTFAVAPDFPTDRFAVTLP